ncbi:hemerythrin HHE cation binding domain-containing protein [Trichoderma gracile]
MSLFRSQAFSIASRVARQTQPRCFSTTPLLMNRISDAIVKDHRELEDYYNRITQSKDLDEQTRYQNQFVWELARHSISEELVVYPVLEKSIINGQQIAQKDRQEHQKVKEKLYEFQKLSAKDPDFIPTLKSLYTDLKQHIREEEEEDLPKLEQAVSGDESRQLSKSFQRTKMFVPTHSHPSAPDKPPFETVVGLLSAPLDKLMDAFKKFPKD